MNNQVGNVQHQQWERDDDERKITLKAAVLSCWPNDLSTPIHAIRIIKEGNIEILFPQQDPAIGNSELDVSSNRSWKVIRQYGKRMIYPNDQLRRKMSNGTVEIRSVPALPVVVAMYKPSGYVVTKCSTTATKGWNGAVEEEDDCDMHDEDTTDRNCSDAFSVYDLLTSTCLQNPTITSADIGPFLPQLRAVGRLDKDTEGLLLFTNHGRWITALTTPSQCGNGTMATFFPKRYRCWLSHPATDSDVLSWLDGCIRYRHRNSVGGMTTSLPAVAVEFVNATNRHVVDVTIGEGKYRQIRRCWEALSNKVVQLRRLSFGTITLDHVLTQKPGQCRIVSHTELRSIEQCVQNWYRANNKGNR
jgi:pseudouridine synthase